MNDYTSSSDKILFYRLKKKEKKKKEEIKVSTHIHTQKSTIATNPASKTSYLQSISKQPNDYSLFRERWGKKVLYNSIPRHYNKKVRSYTDYSTQVLSVSALI